MTLFPLQELGPAVKEMEQEAGPSSAQRLQAHPLNPASMDLEDDSADDEPVQPETHGGQPPSMDVTQVLAGPTDTDAPAKAERQASKGSPPLAPVVVSNAIVSIRTLEHRLAVERLQAAAAAHRHPMCRAGAPPRPAGAPGPVQSAAASTPPPGTSPREGAGLTIRVRSKRPGMWIADAEAQGSSITLRAREGGGGPWSARRAEGSGAWSPNPAEEEEQDRRRSTGSTPTQGKSLSSQVRARVAEFESIVEKSRSLQAGFARPQEQ